VRTIWAGTTSPRIFPIENCFKSLAARSLITEMLQAVFDIRAVTISVISDHFASKE
jgi:hypothetical protein